MFVLWPLLDAPVGAADILGMHCTLTRRTLWVFGKQISAGWLVYRRCVYLGVACPWLH